MRTIPIILSFCLISFSVKPQDYFSADLVLDSISLCSLSKCDTLLLGLSQPDGIRELYGFTSSSTEVNKYEGRHEHGNYYRQIELRNDSIGAVFMFKSNRCKSKSDANDVATYLYQVYLIAPGKLCLSNGMCIGASELEIESILGRKGLGVMSEPEKKIIMHSDLGLECRYSLVGSTFVLTQLTIDQTARTRILNDRK